MAILNKEEIYYYNDSGSELRLGSTLWYIYDFDDTDYWYIDFHHGWNLIPAIDRIPPDVCDRIRNGSVTLFLNNSHEAFHDPIDYIYRYFVTSLNFPAQNIRLLSESATIHEEVIRIAEQYQQPYIQVEWLRMFECGVSNNMTHTKLDTLEIKEYNKKYLNLNRRWRRHRPIVVALLEYHNLLSQGHISFCKNVDGENWDVIYGFLNWLMTGGETKLFTLMYENRERFENIPDMFLDTTALHINQAQVDENLDQFYLDTYFSIVNETNYFKDLGEGIFLSEKVFKPILKSHPFILVSRPHSLAKLRELGYKTFSPYIDETYDTIEDDSDRLFAIIKEVERLCNLNKEELETFLIEVKKIVEHNYRFLMNKKTKLRESYVTKLL